MKKENFSLLKSLISFIFFICNLAEFEIHKCAKIAHGDIFNLAEKVELGLHGRRILGERVCMLIPVSCAQTAILD